MDDRAMHAPGPMGWGFEHQSLDDRKFAEESHFAALSAIAPRWLMRRTAREPNAELLSRVMEEMKRDGMDAGFSFLHLERVVFGDYLPWLPQIIGSCVASGGMRAMTHRMLVEVFLLNDPETLFGTSLVDRVNLAPFAPFNYRAGRRIAGINGNSDGSLCLPHIRGAMQYGILPCSADGLQSDAYPEPQNTATYRQWGADNRLMDRFAAFAKRFLLIESTKVENGADGKAAAVEDLKPSMVCSSWSFVPDYVHPTWRLRDGTPVTIYKRGREPWYHNMSKAAVVQVGNRWFVIILNSWGDAHKNGTWFAIPIELYDEWMRQAESQTIGDIDMSDNPPVFGDPLTP